MSLYTYNGMILREGLALAASEDCCCGVCCEFLPCDDGDPVYYRCDTIPDGIQIGDVIEIDGFCYEYNGIVDCADETEPAYGDIYDTCTECTGDCARCVGSITSCNGSLLVPGKLDGCTISPNLSLFWAWTASSFGYSFAVGGMSVGRTKNFTTSPISCSDVGGGTITRSGNASCNVSAADISAVKSGDGYNITITGVTDNGGCAKCSDVNGTYFVPSL